MHRIAEIGIALHFKYKEGNQNHSKDDGLSYCLEHTSDDDSSNDLDDMVCSESSEDDVDRNEMFISEFSNEM
eukprot:4086907-Ditylum_brightwellii.AAC.1